VCNAATLTFVLGEIVEPEFANEGDTVAPGSIIQTGADGLVIVEQRWQSDYPNRDCVQLDIVGAEQRFTVIQAATPGRCQPTTPGSRPDTKNISSEIRYGDAKMDEFNPPEKVSASVTAWRSFDRWMDTATRSYTGTLESAQGGKLVLRDTRTGQRRTFRQSGSIPGNVPVSLVGKKVRVDYRKGGAGHEAVGLTSLEKTQPSLSPPTLRTKPVAPALRPNEPDTPAKDPRDKWRCTINLHQGDTGTLEFARRGERIKGEIRIERGSQQHTVTGTWSEETIEFWRDLGGNTGQQFQGSVIETEKGSVRMTGRFAAGYRGVWSADCAVQGKPDSDSGSAGKRFDVILTGFEGNKIGVIKAIRSVTGLGLKDADDALRNLPFVLGAGLAPEESRRMAATMRASGAEIEIVASE
jgi:large subunit ribosomal protein L7/L12